MNAPTENLIPNRRREALLLVAICLAIFATRLPWISAGFGSDADAYRVVNAAREIAQSGQYVRSRPPGCPAYEGLIAITSAWTSPVLSNGLSAIASCLASLFFAFILRQFQIRPYLLLTAAFAMTPVVYVNSVTTMDYVFALALMLGGTYFVLIERPITAGILLGLATGFRITSGAMLIPLGIWMLFNDRTPQTLKRLLILGVTSLLVGMICFGPVFHRYWGDVFTYHGKVGRFTLDALYWTLVLGVWGELASLGLLGVACLVPFNLKSIKATLAQPTVRRGLALALSTVVLYFAIFLSLPHENAYLIPVVPFTLLAIALVFPPRIVICFAVLLCFSSFISIGDKMGVTLVGPIRIDHDNRDNRVQGLSKVIEHVAQLRSSSVIVVGWNEPQILATVGEELRENHQYVYLVKDVDTYKGYVKQGRTVYFLPRIDEFNLDQTGVDLRRLGAKPLGETGER